MIFNVVIAALVIMATSLAGVLFVHDTMNSWMKRRIKLLVAFSIGVFLAIVYHLISEVVHESHLSASFILLYIIAGAFTLEFISKLIPDGHHHHGESDHTHSHIDARRMLWSDAFHNISDGLLIVPAFMASLEIGIGISIAIILHEFVQEISEFFVLREAGYSSKEALVKNFLVSITIFIGIGLSFLLSSVESLQAPLIAFTAGGLLYIVIRDLLPDIISNTSSKKKGFQFTLAIILGALVMIGISALFPH